MGVHRTRSENQRTQCMANIAKINLQRMRRRASERTDATEDAFVPLSLYEEMVSTSQKNLERGDAFQQQKRNLTKRHNRLKLAKQGLEEEVAHIRGQIADSETQLAESTTQLHEVDQMLQDTGRELRLEKDKGRKMRYRAPEVISRTVNKEVEKTREWHVKEGGIISEQTRELIRNLVTMGVPQVRVGDVVKSVLVSSGFTVIGEFAPRSVSRIVEEAYIGSTLQIASEIDAATSKHNTADDSPSANLHKIKVLLLAVTAHQINILITLLGISISRRQITEIRTRLQSTNHGFWVYQEL